MMAAPLPKICKGEAHGKLDATCRLWNFKRSGRALETPDRHFSDRRLGAAE
jgi:hypothetical protein